MQGLIIQKSYEVIPKTIEKLISNLFPVPKFFCESAAFFLSGFLSLDIHESHDSKERGRPILTYLYHLHPLCEHLDIRWMIATESSFLHTASDWD